MFSPSNRATSKDIRSLGRRTHTVHTLYFSLRYGAGAHDAPRIAVIVSKKVAARAVDRNRIKRRVRHALSPSHLPPYTYCIYVKKSGAALKGEQLKKEIHTLFNLV